MTCRSVRMILLAAAALGASACASITGSTDPVEIRLLNESTLELVDVRVHFPDGVVNYGTIAPGDSTDYRRSGPAYRYATLEAVIEGELVRMQAIDYVGENRLPAGRHTYRLRVEGTPPDRQIHIVLE